MTAYAAQMRQHLAQYKRDRLGVVEDGIWRSNQNTYGHILPERLGKLNIVETARREFWQYHDAHRATLALHTDFHHLNSSQAFAFNLFFPWMLEDPSAQALLGALGLPDQEVKSWAFEHMPDQDERTSVDFSVEFANGARLLVEVKLTEAHFGQCVSSDSHLRKLTRTYVPRLKERVPPESLEPETFFLNYQLFRNISSLDLSRGDRLVILLPRANELTWGEGERFLARHLLDASRGYAHMVAVEDLVAALRILAHSHAPRLHTHVELLAEKYIPVQSG